MLFTIEKQGIIMIYFPIYYWEHSRNRSHMVFFFSIFFTFLYYQEHGQL
jgi:hypothetical protein